MCRRSSPLAFLCSLSVLAILVMGQCARAEYRGRDSIDIPRDKGIGSSLALEGQFVHRVGELQINITNWGLIGSRPDTGTNYAEAPSAMWPAGSGVDHLWAAGLWIGAIRNGVPLVTTGQFTPELMSSPDDPLDTVWESRAGAHGGSRYPDPGYDDDGDGREDEDPLNGIDDDGDGLIDEDFGAVSDQMFSLSMRDNSPLIAQLWPDHEPLGVRVYQSSYQWSGDDVDDFVGFEFRLKNIGSDPLEDLFVGFFADCDVGPRGIGEVSQDDLPGYFEASIRVEDGSRVPVSIAFTYDADSDGGRAPGFFGIMFVDHPIDIKRAVAPYSMGIKTFQAFAGSRSFEQGGDPINDAERYEAISAAQIDSTPLLYDERFANDYRILMATGRFRSLKPGASLRFRAAMVAGEGLDGLVQHAADAGLTYYGAWFNRDGDFATGQGGTETQICASDFGSPAGDPSNPIYKMFISPCDTIGGGLAFPIRKDWLDKAGCIWVDDDCLFERSRGVFTGVGGREHFVPWLVDLAPQPPDLRVWEADNRTHIFWNSRSQLVADALDQVLDFESYRVWRADNWDRPQGTSIDNGPASALWGLLAEFDLVNSFEDRRVVDGEEVVENLPLGANTGLDMIRYQPLMYRQGTREWESGARARDLVRRILDDPLFAHLGPTHEPADFVRYTTSTGKLTPAGESYPELADFTRSWSAIDTAFWIETGVEFYEYVDQEVLNGFGYFYAVTATDFESRPSSDGPVITGPGIESDPQGNFRFITPRFAAQTAAERESDGQAIFVFPNPATTESLSEFSQLNPNGDDPTGVRVMFANLPASRNTISIYTLAGDLIQTIDHHGTTQDCPGDSGFGNCGGGAYWNLVSRSGQEVVSGIYLYSVESSNAAFDRVIGRFVVIR
ncbi:hypothetical protein DRQ53_13395 [bacterium]|nr:MAG: hypothetical protein DRQ53_13395 [bacterium]